MRHVDATQIIHGPPYRFLKPAHAYLRFEREDLATCIAHLRATGKASQVALWGRSMGAVTAPSIEEQPSKLVVFVSCKPVLTSWHCVLYDAETAAVFRGLQNLWVVWAKRAQSCSAHPGSPQALLHADRDPSIAALVLDSPLAAQELSRKHAHTRAGRSGSRMVTCWLGQGSHLSETLRRILPAGRRGECREYPEPRRAHSPPTSTPICAVRTALFAPCQPGDVSLVGHPCMPHSRVCCCCAFLRGGAGFRTKRRDECMDEGAIIPGARAAIRARAGFDIEDCCISGVLAECPWRVVTRFSAAQLLL